MPLGLRNATGTFQHTMNFILPAVKWQFSLVCLDDIVGYSKSPEEHSEPVHSVLMLLSDAGVTIKLKKCRFFAETIDCFVHVIRSRRLKIASDTTHAISKLQTPTFVSKLMSLLELCNVFRRFVPNFARIAAQLNKLLQKDQPAWFKALDETKLAALKTLKAALIKPPVLTLPNKSGHITLDVDTCNVQIGYVLFQELPEDTLKPIGHWSRSLSAADRKYVATRRECFANVCAVLVLRPCLQGNHITICTDRNLLR